MKNLSKKLLVSAIASLVFGGGILLFGMMNKEMSLSEITGNRIDRYALARDADGNIVDVAEIIGYYNAQQYCRFYGNPGNTARRSWTFFDSSGKELFVLTDLGNRNLIQILISENIKTYRFRKS